MPPSQRSNPLALTVLVLLFEKPMHPYEMAQTLRERHKEESIRLNYGSLYSVVRSLERNGLIRTKETQREGRRPQRTVYELTPAGRAAMHGWLSELVSTPTKEYLQFEAALSLIGALHPDEALDLLRHRCEALELEISRARTQLDKAVEDYGLPRLFVLEGDYQLALAEADLAFTRQLVADIEQGRLSGLREWRIWHETGRMQWPLADDMAVTAGDDLTNTDATPNEEEDR
jgi:DNA-binding PadR family transcriptional regulator